MPCVVCGTPETVKAHIVPRSLFRLQNPTGRQVIGNRRDGPGHLFPQSGFWDREILCSDHEQALHAPDDYAFRFCREFVSHATSGAPVTISNPKPAQLQGPFFGGDAPSAADFTVYGLLTFLAHIGRQHPSADLASLRGPRLVAWGRQVEALEYFAETWPDHWPPIPPQQAEDHQKSGE